MPSARGENFWRRESYYTSHVRRACHGRLLPAGASVASLRLSTVAVQVFARQAELTGMDTAAGWAFCLLRQDRHVRSRGSSRTFERLAVRRRTLIG